MRRLPFRRLVSLATLAAGRRGHPGRHRGVRRRRQRAEGASGPVTLRLGYFPNITHAPAVVGVEKGIFADKLGSDVKLETKTFNAGPAAVEAIFSGALDATYIGPNPTVNAYAKSKGEAVRVISGAASGGVALVVKPEITSAEQLRGKKIATPQLGNTQDVALRYWLKEKGLKTTRRAAATSRSSRRRTPRRSRPSPAARSTAPGCPSRSPPGWSTPAARCSSTSATSGRTGSSSSPT